MNHKLLKLPEQTHTNIKVEAAKRQITMMQLVERAVYEYCQRNPVKWNTPTKEPAP